jgi:hypothetical protein
VTRRQELLRGLVVLAAGVLAGERTFRVVTSQWATRGKPEVHVPTDGPALGFSYAVTMTPPWWAWPVAIVAGGLAATGVFVSIRQRG